MLVRDAILWSIGRETDPQELHHGLGQPLVVAHTVPAEDLARSEQHGAGMK